MALTGNEVIYAGGVQPGGTAGAYPTLQTVTAGTLGDASTYTWVAV